MKTCTIPDCKKPLYNSRGWCHMHYERWRIHGDPLAIKIRERPRGMTKPQLVEWCLKDTVPKNGCLISNANKSSGYGMAYFNGKFDRIHRLVLEVKLGRELKSGEWALHRCHNRACINPDHLYAGNHQDNMADKKSSGRSARHHGEASSFSKLTNEAVLEIRRLRKSGYTYSTLAEKFDVSISNIAFIATGKTWKHIMPSPDRA